MEKEEWSEVIVMHHTCGKRGRPRAHMRMRNSLMRRKDNAFRFLRERKDAWRDKLGENTWFRLKLAKRRHALTKGGIVPYFLGI
jgi:hypothetical protein